MLACIDNIEVQQTLLAEIEPVKQVAKLVEFYRPVKQPFSLMKLLRNSFSFANMKLVSRYWKAVG